MGLSTHILDTASGKPAAGVTVVLLRRTGASWEEVGRGQTDADGRCRTLLGENTLTQGEYRLRFETGAYFAAGEHSSLYPFVEVTFSVQDPGQHFHIPLLIAANGYTTYRGS